MPKDPRDGLRRKYSMDEVLELYGGRNSIKPLNYDALAMLKNPLYVKMAQTMSDTVTDQNNRLLAELQRVNAARALASQTGVSYEQMHHSSYPSDAKVGTQSGTK